ncbi:histone deacetylase family protein [Methyloferula stellata]|uniref:histone deacetylase family protein n=1 Tax=Methyloferula stellata TaxID=876270 RepID=UPI0003A89A79|nr:histone deacetylase family protein [Methyloferula stellata]
MTTLFLSHPSGLEHDTGAGHPERADRLRIIEQMVEHERFQNLHRALAPGADTPALLRVHPEEYVRAIENAAPKEGLVRVDGDTIMSPGTWTALMHTIGGASAAVNEVMRGNAANAFVAMRPCGHHAERATPMGFCFFNTAAIAARHAQAVHGAERVAIVDFDVHHGNGTQDIFWDDPSVLYCSTHQMPLFPGTGAVGEVGEHNTIVNAPLSPGDGSEAFRAAMETRVLPRVDAFAPDLIVISAGFDAHRLDPLASINLEAVDFAWITEKLMGLAAKHSKGRIVSVLEGGYDLEGLAASSAAHLLMLMSA